MALRSLSGVDVTDDGLAVVGGVGGQVEVLLLLMSHGQMTTRSDERGGRSSVGGAHEWKKRTAAMRKQGRQAGRSSYIIYILRCQIEASVSAAASSFDFGLYVRAIVRWCDC